MEVIAEPRAAWIVSSAPLDGLARAQPAAITTEQRNMRGPSLNHLIRPLQKRWRDRQADGLGGLEVDDQFELGGLFDRKIAGLRAFEDSIQPPLLGPLASAPKLGARCGARAAPLP